MVKPSGLVERVVSPYPSQPVSDNCRGPKEGEKDVELIPCCKCVTLAAMVQRSRSRVPDRDYLLKEVESTLDPRHTDDLWRTTTFKWLFSAARFHKLSEGTAFVATRIVDRYACIEKRTAENRKYFGLVVVATLCIAAESREGVKLPREKICGDMHNVEELHKTVKDVVAALNGETYEDSPHELMDMVSSTTLSESESKKVCRMSAGALEEVACNAEYMTTASNVLAYRVAMVSLEVILLPSRFQSIAKEWGKLLQVTEEEANARSEPRRTVVLEGVVPWV